MSTAVLAPGSVGSGARVASLPVAAAALSLSAALAHFGVMVPHFAEWWAHGAFFLVCGVTQALFAALVVWRPASWLTLTGIAGNLAIVGMYVYSRTNGAPFGPHEGFPEAPGLLDLTTTAEELVLVVVLIAMLGERPRRGAMWLVMLLGLGLWLGRATGIVL